MAHREAAPYVALIHPQDPNVRTTELGAGDRAIEDARRALLDPLGLAPGSPKAAPKETPKAGDLKDPTQSSLEIAYATSRAMAQRAAAAQAAAQKKAEATRNFGWVYPTPSKEALADYARLQESERRFDEEQARIAAELAAK